MGGPLVEGDIVPLTDPSVPRHVPKHDVLAAGFPCQPFSKSGYQRGVDEARGTLFFNILKLIEARRPPLIFLENVRNLAGPEPPRDLRHDRPPAAASRDTGSRRSPRCSRPTSCHRSWAAPLRSVTASTSLPHAWAVDALWPRLTFRAQSSTHPVDDWDPSRWDIDAILDDDKDIPDLHKYLLSPEERRWIRIWDDFVKRVTDRAWFAAPRTPLVGGLLPQGVTRRASGPAGLEGALHPTERGPVPHPPADDRPRGSPATSTCTTFPASRRKLEWQAQDLSSLTKTVMHFRPSGIRAKAPTYLPALVAMTQTSIIGSRGRRITPREAARLQGLPEGFNFGDQADSHSYRQLGNAIAVGAAGTFSVSTFAGTPPTCLRTW